MKKSGKFTLKTLVTALSAVAAITTLSFASSAFAAEKLEKENLKLGFIKLTDMAPLAVAYEKGYFEDEGLSVQVEAQANWKVLLDRVINGELDGAHMLAHIAVWNRDWLWHQSGHYQRIHDDLKRRCHYRLE